MTNPKYLNLIGRMPVFSIGRRESRAGATDGKQNFAFQKDLYFENLS
ncbi:hypothetical protein [Pedobacter miscanthi]|nr:hypothetical protein [Pedobacter miscanthi]